MVRWLIACRGARPVSRLVKELRLRKSVYDQSDFAMPKIIFFHFVSVSGIDFY